MNYSELNRAKQALKEEQSILSKEIRKEYSIWFRLMDILIVMMLLSNLGAVFLTNAMVTKATPDVVIMEVNPVMANAHNWEEHPESNTLYLAFIKQALFYALMLTSYVMFRQNIFTERMLWLGFGFIASCCFISLLDFFNDFGFWIGKLLAC